MLVILYEQFFIASSTFWNTEDYGGIYLFVCGLFNSAVFSLADHSVPMV
jgi:hypothetical protein